ncbi:hypothetical protein [uncultured Bartonella sp.]|nr:hypothetical protein [uncultured Bartonella sp.]
MLTLSTGLPVKAAETDGTRIGRRQIPDIAINSIEGRDNEK